MARTVPPLPVSSKRQTSRTLPGNSGLDGPAQASLTAIVSGLADLLARSRTCLPPEVSRELRSIHDAAAQLLARTERPQPLSRSGTALPASIIEIAAAAQRAPVRTHEPPKQPWLRPLLLRVQRQVRDGSQALHAKLGVYRRRLAARFARPVGEPVPEAGMFSSALLRPPRRSFKSLLMSCGIHAGVVAAIVVIAPRTVLTHLMRAHETVVWMASSNPPRQKPPAPRRMPVRVVRLPFVASAKAIYAPRAARPLPELRVEEAPRIQVSQPKVPAVPVPAVAPPPVVSAPRVQNAGFDRPPSLPVPETPRHTVVTGGFETSARAAETKNAGTVRMAGFQAAAGAAGGLVRSGGTVATGGFDVPQAAVKSAPAGTIGKTSFDMAAAPVQLPERSAAIPRAPVKQPVEILDKPKPRYTEEARKRKIEGSVMLEVTFTAGGQVRVLRVVKGLGSGLDESACEAARLIRFKPATQDGRPVDQTAVLHIVFQISE